MGGCKPQSSWMPGGLFQNRIHLRVITNTDNGSNENLTNFPLAICLQKSAKQESAIENPRKFKEKSRQKTTPAIVLFVALGN
jgi:hypothetical protein